MYRTSLSVSVTVKAQHWVSWPTLDVSRTWKWATKIGPESAILCNNRWPEIERGATNLRPNRFDLRLRNLSYLYTGKCWSVLRPQRRSRRPLRPPACRSGSRHAPGQLSCWRFVVAVPLLQLWQMRPRAETRGLAPARDRKFCFKKKDQWPSD